MLFFEILIGVFLLGAFVHFWFTKRKNEHDLSLLVAHLNTSEEFKKTLAMGLYLRFRQEKEFYKPLIESSEIFIKENPIQFESFVASIIESSRGGNTWVFPASGDFGVDFEHNLENKKFLGQVKCKQDNLSFDPIAILHSNIVKQNADGGYVITTSSFTKHAKEYAKNLNVELIDGIKLVELWLEGIEIQEKELRLLPVE